MICNIVDCHIEVNNSTDNIIKMLNMSKHIRVESVFQGNDRTSVHIKTHVAIGHIDELMELITYHRSIHPLKIKIKKSKIISWLPGKKQGL